MLQNVILEIYEVHLYQKALIRSLMINQSAPDHSTCQGGLSLPHPNSRLAPHILSITLLYLHALRILFVPYQNRGSLFDIAILDSTPHTTPRNLEIMGSPPVAYLHLSRW
jgi:hypothetical protein